MTSRFDKNNIILRVLGFLEFIWDTTGIAKGTYRIKAVASVVSGEEDVADNTYIDGTVKIGSSSQGGGGGGGGSGEDGGEGENEQPRADFTYSPSYPTDLDTVQFTDESYDPNGSITSWFWDFGDGSIATDQNPTHRYADDGNYTVTLVVGDDGGALDEITKQIVILNVPPKADFTINSPPKPASQNVIQFNDLSSDSDGLIVSWRWEFGDGTTSTDKNPTHKYENPGTYTIRLTVTDDDGATAEALKIYDALPPATIDDYDGSWHTEDFTINLTATDDYSGVQTTYYRFNSDSIKSVQADGQPHITMEGPGKLEYWSVDAEGNEEAHHVIDVKLDKMVPVADARGDRNVNPNTIASFDASGSSDNVGIVSYEWDFGDGSAEASMKVNHTYVKPGTYVVTLTVRDAAGNTNTGSIFVLVFKDTDGDGTPDMADSDDDGDGMMDAWEIYYGLDPLNASDASFDPDGDDLTNLQEHQAGSDPYNYLSPLPLWVVAVVAIALVIIVVASIFVKNMR